MASSPSRRIALLVPELPTAEELAPYLRRIDEAHWYTNFGPLVRELEADMARRLSEPGLPSQHVVSVSNATLGLELALLALKLPPGSRVLMPALTFVASAAAAMRAGCVPVFCDIEPDTWILSPRIAREALRKVRVDVVMPVSTYGCPQDMKEWDAFSDDTGIPVVVDAAGAFGNQSAGVRCVSVFSLHATKALAGAEGGFVCAADPIYAGRVRVLSNFGIEPATDTQRATGTTGVVHSAGTNGKLSEYHAAIALAALERWERTSTRRIDLHRAYIELLAEHCPQFQTQSRAPNDVYSILPVLTPAGCAAIEVCRFLERRGIETRRWYCPPLPVHPAFSAMPVTGPLDVARQVGERLLAVPFHLHLTYDDIFSVTKTLGQFRDSLG
ncbi:MAG: DegT/DnrJ/EryC1/StrS family aminotransferase [Betaproteobacteria bacterium]|nr:DegT/DnrJ/EryC1/StrS family aminotransferase [Betaproteobacteria bacterium]